MKILGKVKKVLVSIILILAVLATASIAKSSISEPFRNRLEKTMAEIDEIKNMNIIGLGNDSGSRSSSNSSIESYNLAEISNDKESELSSDALEDSEQVKDDTYNVQVELKIVDQDGEGITEGNKLKVTDVTKNSSEQGVDEGQVDEEKENKLDIKILNLFSGDVLEQDQDGNISTDNQGIIIDLNNLIQNKEYQILIEDIQSADGYLKTINSLILQVSIDDEENIIAKIVNIKDLEDKDVDITGQNDAKLQGAEDGTLKIEQEEHDSDTQIKYLIKDGTIVEGDSEEIGGNENWQEYSGSVKIEQNSKVYAKAIKNGKESGISLKVVNNIDKEAPKLESCIEPDEEQEIEEKIQVVLTDNASGIVKYGLSRTQTDEPDKYIYPDKNLSQQDILEHRNLNPQKNITETIDEIYENGTYYIWIWDTAGNCQKADIKITKIKERMVAKIVETDDENSKSLENQEYTSLYKALKACPANKNTTIMIIDEIYNESNEINNKNIKLNLNGYTVNNKNANKPAITVNENATLTLVNTNESGQNLTKGALQSENTNAILVKENGTINIGQNDRRVLINSPSIIGKGTGLVNKGTFNFYDGIITAKKSGNGDPSAFSGEIGEMPVAYSTAVEDSGEGDEKIQTARLAVIAGVEAKIGKSTYTQIEEAIKDARNSYR